MNAEPDWISAKRNCVSFLKSRFTGDYFCNKYYTLNCTNGKKCNNYIDKEKFEKRKKKLKRILNDH